MSELDDIRGKLFKSEGEFVEQLKSADKTSPEVRAEALVRLNAIYKYASIKGRGRFLDEMEIEGSAKKRKVAFDMCHKAKKPEAECDALMETIPAFRPLLEAWPKDNTGPAWWSAPLTHLIGTYDPSNPPAGELGDWRDNIEDPVVKGGVVIGEWVADTAEDVGEAVADAVADTLEPEPETTSWWKVGAGVGAVAITGAVVYRIAKG